MLDNLSVKLWAVDPLVQMFQDDLPPVKKAASEVLAARNELETAQFGLRADTQLTNISGHVIGMPSAKVEFVGHVPLTLNTHESPDSEYVRKAPDMFPDQRISDPAATSMEWTPVVAWNGTEYLVVWMDERNPPSRLRDIFGRRVSAAGSPIGEAFLISGSGATGNDVNPAVAWNGAEYLVVWEDYRNASNRGGDIYGRVVQADGSRPETDFRISGAEATDDDGSPDVVWNGTEYLVVWSDERNSSRGADIYGRRVSAGGVPITGDFRISGPKATSSDWSAAAAWNEGDGRYLVVWSDNRDSSSRGADIYGRMVLADGARPASDFRISGPKAVLSDQNPAVAWDGAGYLVVWQDNRNYLDREQDIYGRVVLADGSRPKADFRISGTKATHDDESPDVAWNGTHYLVVWEDFRSSSSRGADIYGRMVLADGARPAPDFRISSTAAISSDWDPAVAWNGVSHLVVWQDFRDSGSRGADIYGRRVGG